MKIVQFIDSMTYGGAESVVSNIACEMKRQGIDVTVMCFSIRRNTVNEERLDNAGVRTVFIAEDCINALHLNKYRNTCLRFVAQILLSVHFFRKYMKEINPDVLHMHLDGLLFYPFVSSGTRKTRAFMWTVHSKPDEVFKGLLGKIKKYILKANNGIRVLALNEKDSDKLRQVVPDNEIIVTENGISFERFIHPTKGRLEVRKELGIPEDAFVLGNVGRFGEIGEPIKNQRFIIEIFDELIKSLSNSFLMLAGGGQPTRELKELIEHNTDSDRIVVLSDRNDIPELMAAMDMFVMPSLYEGFPMTLIEAQVSGLKCLVSDRVTKEVALTDNMCFMSLDEPADKWSDRLLSFKGSRECNKKLDDYDIENVVKQLCRLYLKYN